MYLAAINWTIKDPEKNELDSDNNKTNLHLYEFREYIIEALKILNK